MLNLSDAEAREWAKSGIHASGEASPPLPKPTTPEPAPVLPAPSTLISPAPAADINSPPTPGALPPQPQPAASPVPAPDEAGVGLRKARAEYLPQLTLADTGAPSAERGMDRGASSLGSPRRDTALLRQAWTVPKLSATRCRVSGYACVRLVVTVGVHARVGAPSRGAGTVCVIGVAADGGLPGSSCG